MFAEQSQGWAAVGEVLAGAGRQGDGVLLPVPIRHLPALPGSGEFEISFCQAGAGAPGAFLLHLGDDVWREHARRLTGVAV